MAASCYIYTACYASSRFTPARGKGLKPALPLAWEETETNPGRRNRNRKEVCRERLQEQAGVGGEEDR